MPRCTICHRLVDTRIPVDTDHLCNRCYNRYAVECAECGDTTTQHICSRCMENMFHCFICGRHRHNDEAIDTELGPCCRSCVPRIRNCEICDSMYVTDETSNSVCPSCLSEIIHYHDFQPPPKFLGRPAELYFGVELEVECPIGDRVRIAQQILKAVNNSPLQYIYIVHDGSLSHGIEIVSQPATLDYHLQEFPWSTILDTIIVNKCVVAPSCGLHVHASKAAITLAEQMRIQYFVYSQDILFERLGRRSFNNYARYKNKSLSCYSLDQYSEDRYEAFNITNDETVEFRMFRSTRELRVLRATLELCDAVLSFARVTSFVQLKDSRKARKLFLDHVGKCRYKNLITYMARRGIS